MSKTDRGTHNTSSTTTLLRATVWTPPWFAPNGTPTACSEEEREDLAPRVQTAILVTRNATEEAILYGVEEILLRRLAPEPEPEPEPEAESQANPEDDKSSRDVKASAIGIDEWLRSSPPRDADARSAGSSPECTGASPHMRSKPARAVCW